MQSARLKYLEIEQGHSPLLFLLLTNSDVRKYLGGAVNEIKAKERVADLVSHPPQNPLNKHWIMQNEHAEDIGLISLGIYYDDKSTEISYSLLPKFWRKGYALEAVKRISAWSKENLETNYLIAETQAINLNSIKLLENSGFEFKRFTERFNKIQAIYQLNLLDLSDKKT